jgi:DNA-binding response OmpR family regulator
MALSILLVDDDDHFRGMLSEALTREGFQVREASDGRQGIKLYEEQSTDICDYRSGLKISLGRRNRPNDRAVRFLLNDCIGLGHLQVIL